MSRVPYKVGSSAARPHHGAVIDVASVIKHAMAKLTVVTVAALSILTAASSMRLWIVWYSDSMAACDSTTLPPYRSVLPCDTADGMLTNVSDSQTALARTRLRAEHLPHTTKATTDARLATATHSALTRSNSGRAHHPNASPSDDLEGARAVKGCVTNHGRFDRRNRLRVAC